MTYYRPSNLFKGRDVVSGIYRGYHFKLEILGEIVGKEDGYTSITLSTISPTISRFSERAIGLVVEPLLTTDPLQVFTTSHQLRGRITGGQDPVIVHYEQDGTETDMAYLQSVLDLQADIADTYSYALAFEGKAVSVLREVVKDDKNELRSVAIQLLEDIADTISVRLSDSDTNLFCLNCWTYYKRHRIYYPPWVNSFSYHGCRLCHGSEDCFEGKVIAVLDRTANEDSFQKDDVLWINWLARREPFDFDEVSIIQASDEEVERFAVQVGNDTDPFRKPRYKEMRCSIASGCELSENTKRILRQMFKFVS